ncbi:MAG: LysM peptidoglycan-binding domain-containing protein [Roseibium sp.]|nr:LysM peptidoglycan-binding domain-containing protein [Roseibium sp.]
MTKQALIWSLISASVVGATAIGTGYVYWDRGSGAPVAESVQDSTATDTAEPPQTAAPEVPAEIVEAPAPESETAEAEDETAAADGEPTFDVVGIEPTGETVVAGRSEAGAIVALTANGKVVGKAIADSRGEWTIVLEEPLEPGDYDVGLEVQDEAGETQSQSDQRLAVSIPEGGQEQPLIVLNTPDAPSSVLQKPEATEPAQVATGAGSGASQQLAAVEDTPATVAETAPASAPGAQPAPVETPATESATVETPVEESVASAPVEGTSQPESSPQVAIAPAPPSPAEEPAPAPVAVAEDPSSDPAPTDGATGMQVTVEAVESEDDQVFVAGTGEPGSSVRVYVDDTFAGEATVGPSGRWLLEGQKAIPEGDVEVRADLVPTRDGGVEARAAVTFEKAAPQQIVLTKVIASGATAEQDASGANVNRPLPNVIIRKGDNLWRISRRLYGEGIRYTTIYQANKGQIRNPDLIYPGQVFLTPEGDLSWPESQAPSDTIIQ